MGKDKKKAKKVKTFWKDFKAFISKGNIVDLAIAVVIGGAFGKIVTSLVNDLISPLIALLTGGVTLSEMKILISPAVYGEDGAVVTAEAAIRYGAFLQTILDFLIIALAVFVAFRIFNRVSAKIKASAAQQIAKLKELTKSRDESDKDKVAPTTDTDKVADTTDTASTDKPTPPIQKDKAADSPTTNELLIQIRDLLQKQK